MQGDAADLHALLAAAKVAGPYVLVGHSLGGFIATTYARTFPDVTGLVLVDAASQYLQTTLGSDAFAGWAKALMESAPTDPGLEAPDIAASVVAIDTLPPVPPMPVAVITADQSWGFAFPVGEGQRDYWPQWLEAQNLLATSLDATHITKTSSRHEVYIENAGVVNEQICAVITPAKNC